MTDSSQLNALSGLIQLDSMLHEPSRLILMAFLSVVSRADFVFLANQTGLSKGNLSVQMSRLAEAGYIKIEKEFVENRPRTTYQMTGKGRAAFRTYRVKMIDLLGSLPD